MRGGGGCTQHELRIKEDPPPPHVESTFSDTIYHRKTTSYKVFGGTFTSLSFICECQTPPPTRGKRTSLSFKFMRVGCRPPKI